MSDVAERKMTIDEFLAWAEAQPGDDRYELIDGRPVAMAPERLGHARAKLSATLALGRAARAKGLPCEAIIDSILIPITQRQGYIPDVILQCGERLGDDQDRSQDPVLVVEVLSPSTTKSDQSRKLIGYFQVPSIRHYLILDAEERAVIHHHRATEGGQILTDVHTQGVIAIDPPGFELAVADLFSAD